MKLDCVLRVSLLRCGVLIQSVLILKHGEWGDLGVLIILWLYY